MPTAPFSTDPPKTDQEQGNPPVSHRDNVLVSTEWLAERLGDPDIVVIDGSWHLPGQGRDGRAEYDKAHIPGAIFFDIDAVADTGNPLPHMLPTPEAFAAAAGALRTRTGERGGR